ncbi:hypothetical protein LTR17_011645 [Elasticomyces elasticus]|nr:hypothetical protein LTR17_011645 [Elasticomyces elasticus]
MPAPHQRQATRLAPTNVSTHEAPIQVSSQQAWQMISTLDEDDLRRLLYRATQLPGGTELSRSISALCTKNKLVEKVTVTSFEEYINEASQIWSTYSSNSGSKEYENAGRAASDFGTLVEQIENEVTSDSSYHTKRNALSALTTIGLEIVRAPSTCLGSEVRKHWQRNTSLATAMCQVFDAMTEGELSTIRDDKKTFDDLQSLEGSAEGYGLRMNFDMVLGFLTKKPEEAEQEDEKIFDDCLDKMGAIWRRFTAKTDAKERRNALPASTAIEAIITDIRNQLSRSDSYASKANGLDALIDVGGDIVDAPLTKLGHEVRINFQSNRSLCQAMDAILGNMDAAEMRQIQGDVGLLGKLEALENNAKEYAMEMNLRTVMEMLGLHA